MKLQEQQHFRRGLSVCVFFHLSQILITTRTSSIVFHRLARRKPTMVADFPPSSTPLGFDNDLSETLSSFDLIDVFDDVEMPFEGALEFLNPTSSPEDTVPALQAPELTNSILMPPQTQGEMHSDFVNVLLIVDPVQQKVFFPHQLLTHRQGDKVETALFGPVALDKFPAESISDLSQQMTQVQPPPVAPVSASSSASLVSCGTYQDPNAAPSSSEMARAVSPPESVSSSDVLTMESSGTSEQPPSPPSISKSALPPLRALSAYNFFFRDERERILHGGGHDFTSSKERLLLTNHWNQDRYKKRRHRKTHGKIDFTTLSKLISQRWKKLPEEGKNFYRCVAAKDWGRYQREINAQRTSASDTKFTGVVG